MARTAPGHPLRLLLHQRLVDWCAVADRQMAADREQDRREGRDRSERAWHREFAAQFKPRGSLMDRFAGRAQHTRRPLDIPWELKDETVVEFLALLGADLGDGGAAILGRLAKDAPMFLGPVVDDTFSAAALAAGRRGLLAELTEAYYLDDEDHELGLMDDGIRDHRYAGFGAPQAAWHRGPFTLLLRIDFSNGVAILNRLLNHAARVRARTLVDIDRRAPWHTETISRYGSKLALDGRRRRYVGDTHVWRWYRGNAVGPYPCISGLQALERECERLIEGGSPIGSLIPALLDGCENLAMPGLAAGMLLRHAEDADRLLDPYLVEPLVWHLEFDRAVQEASPMVTRTEGLANPERRKWSLREAAMVLVLRADGERVSELQALGVTLVRNARRLARGPKRGNWAGSAFAVEVDREQLPVHARAWASSLDRETYRARRTGDSVIVETAPPADVSAELESDREDAEGAAEAMRLFIKYHVKPSTDGAAPVEPADLVADVVVARKLLEKPPAHSPHNCEDVCALVAVAVLEAHLVAGRELPDDTLLFAAEVVLQIGETSPRPQDVEGMLYEYGADRSASRAIPLLLLPAAAGFLARGGEGDPSTTLDRAVRAGVNLARTASYEVRLHLGRGLDHLWAAPCARSGRCHHEAGWYLATETMRHCALGPMDHETGLRPTPRLEDPLGESLAGVADGAVIVSRLDGAIRALAPAAVAGICVSTGARDLLSTVFVVQRRSLLASERGTPDERGTHSLVGARAMLVLAGAGDDAGIIECIDAYADNSAMLDNLLRGLSAAAEESAERAAAARRVWPDVVRRIFELRDAGRKPFAGRHFGDRALASVVPVATGELPYPYRELDGEAITWWDPEALRPEVEAWVMRAAGNGMCANQLVGFLAAISADDQVRVGLGWMGKLVLSDPERAARSAVLVPGWLIDVRSAADNCGCLETWQAIVDALVVAGVRRLAPYSD